MVGPETELTNEFMDALTSLPSPDSLLAEHGPTRDAFEGASSIETAMFYGALLLDPRLQANCVRLEALVHMAIATADGQRRLSLDELRACFDEMNDGVLGLAEDPSEDVFVSNLATARGNFLILEGTWESGTFYLQRFMEILDSTPETDEFLQIREAIYAVLKLSDTVCCRARLCRNMGGDEHRADKLLADVAATVDPKILAFTEADLDSLGVDINRLTQFALTTDWKEIINTLPVGRSPLQFLPLIRTNDSFVLLLPTAVSFSLRTHLMTPLEFRGDDLPIAEAMVEADTGRFLHILCFPDTLRDYSTEGVSGTDPTPFEMSARLGERIAAAQRDAKQRVRYRKGMTLAVYCGLGRSCSFEVPTTDETWTVQSVPAAHLVELSCVKGFSDLKLWKILEAVDRLRDVGVELANINGLLNLVGWVQSNGGHLVPHSQLPKGLRQGTGVFQLPTNSLRKLRLETSTRIDRIGVPDVEGRVVAVRRANDSFFPKDDALPLYLPEFLSPDLDIPFVYVSGMRAWWCFARTSEQHWRGLYQRWEVLKTWFPLVIPVLEPILTALAETVRLEVTFCTLPGDGPLPTVPSQPEIRASLLTEVDQATNTVTIEVGEAFERGQRHETNIAERALVTEICAGFARLAGHAFEADELDTIVRKIMPNEHGRQMHAVEAQTYRDYVAGDLQDSPITLNELDSATLRVGLAFRAEDRETGRHSIRSKRQATKLLNTLVEDLEDELCEQLRHFDRRALIEMAIRNHETAIRERNQWMRTAKAILAIRHDDKSAINVIAERDGELTGAIFPSHVLLELAVCECSLDGGKLPGRLDLAYLMTVVNAIMELGGWSDAIHLDAMPPDLTITALGDLHADRSWRADVMMPFSKQGSHHRIDTAVGEYADGFRAPEVGGNLGGALDSDFLSAWNEEFGFDLADACKCFDAIEDLGIERGTAILSLRHSELLVALSPKIESEVASAVVAEFTLLPRPEWREVPTGYDKKDIQIWRFRRALSAIRRPIVQLDDATDPTLMIAPGYVRDCFAYVAGNYFEGTFPDRHYRTAAIRRWHDQRLKDRSDRFANEVAEEIRKADGWQAETHVEVKSLLQRGKDPEFGDVKRFGDVDVLAWNDEVGRMLIVECKHLYYGKTYGEVAEQLRDYRGKIRIDGKREKRDDLRKHLDRLDVIAARQAIVCKTIKIAPSVEIEGWIIFKNPVPMLFAWEEFEHETRIGTFDDILSIVAAR